MSTPTLQDRPPFAGHSPDQHRPLAAYGALMGVFVSLCGAFAAWFRASGRELPDRVARDDLALAAVATHKAARMITHDRVSSVARAPFTTFQSDGGPGEVNEAARGEGLQRAVGELLVCPYCLSMWIGTTFLAGLLVAPRATRWVEASFVVLTGADLLQIGYHKAEELL
jgi:uncharacterized protein DUF1360